MKRFCLLFGLLITTPAAAQIANPALPTNGGDGFLVAQMISPGVGDGRFDCQLSSSSGCKPLNIDACSEDPGRNIQITLTKNASATILVSDNLFVWVQSGSTECNYDHTSMSGALLPSANPHSILLGESILTGVGSYVYPDSFADADDYTTKMLLENTVVSSACSGDGVESYYRICLGIDGNHDGDVNKVTNTGFVRVDYNAWIQFKIDTIAPPAPGTPTVRELDGRLRLSASPSTESRNSDIVQWQVRLMPVTGADEDVPTCDAWESGSYTTKTVRAGPDDGKVEISGTNGVRYAACMLTLDALDNKSDVSTVVFGTPRDECDFMECYPTGKLKGGYCAAGASSAWAVLSSAWIFLQMRRTRRRRESRL